MDNEKRQQALDNLRNALGRLEQSDFTIFLGVGTMRDGMWIYVKGIETTPPLVQEVINTISNHTLRLKTEK